MATRKQKLELGLHKNDAAFVTEDSNLFAGESLRTFLTPSQCKERDAEMTGRFFVCLQGD